MQRILLCHYFLIIFRWPRSAVVVDGCLEHPVVKWILCFPQELGKWEFCMANRRNRNGWRGRGGAKPILLLGTQSTNVVSLSWRNGKKGISKKCKTSDRPPKWVSLQTWFHFSVVRRWKRTCAVCINLEIPHYLPSFRTIYIQKKPWLKETWSHRLLEIFQVYKASFIQPRCSY